MFTSGINLTHYSNGGSNVPNMGINLAMLNVGLVYHLNDISNPTKDTFFIKSKTDVLATNLELFDTTGKLLLSKKLEATPENSISVTNFAKGIYLVTVETTNGNRYNTKLVVE